MRALDLFIDWLVYQKNTEQIYIAKEILKNIGKFERRDFIFEEVESFSPYILEELQGHITTLLDNEKVVQVSDNESL